MQMTLVISMLNNIFLLHIKMQYHYLKDPNLLHQISLCNFFSLKLFTYVDEWKLIGNKRV